MRPTCSVDDADLLFLTTFTWRPCCHKAVSPMKIHLCIFTFLIALLLASQNAMAALSRTAAPGTTEAVSSISIPAEKAGKWEAKKQRWKKKFEKKMAKWTKKAKKIEKKQGTLALDNYLTLCLILFLAALVFFAIGGAVFNIFGSVSALASAVFFVLWLLDYTGNL